MVSDAAARAAAPRKSNSKGGEQTRLPLQQQPKSRKRKEREEEGGAAAAAAPAPPASPRVRPRHRERDSRGGPAEAPAPAPAPMTSDDDGGEYDGWAAAAAVAGAGASPEPVRPASPPGQGGGGGGGRVRGGWGDGSEEWAMRAAIAPPPPPPGGEEGGEHMEPEETITSLAVPPSDVNFDRYEEEEDISGDPHFCFWCHIKQSKQQYKDSKRLKKLIRFWEENKASMEPFEFCRRMQALYNEHARNFMNDDDGDPIDCGPPWPARSIWEHDISHQLRPNAVLEDIARTMHTALLTLRDNGLFIEDTYTRTGTKKRRLDYTASKNYREIVKELRPILDKLNASRNTDLYGLT